MYSFWFYIKINRNMYSNQETINYPTQLHLVDRVCKNCIMMHGTMHVKYSFLLEAESAPGP
jgi:hypothetical protein